MADLVLAKVWLAGPEFERCTAERTETLAYSTERRLVSKFHPLLPSNPYTEEVTRLWALEEIPFDVPPGARVSYVGVRIGEHVEFLDLRSDAAKFDRAGTFLVWPLNFEVRERLDV